MKPNRSDTYTTGICNTIGNLEYQDLRFFFFEVDNPNDIPKVVNLYESEEIDFLVHRTNKGFHFLSPTLIIKEYWKKLINELRDINIKCPMTCLRVEPNKYPNEPEVWYTSKTETFYNQEINSYDMCVYLNHIWKSNFTGSGRQQLKIVRYPLPLVRI